MIPESIAHYLQRNRVPYTRYPHPRAITAQELAEALHVTGYRVAKSVIIRADGRLWIAVLSAVDQLDFRRTAMAIGAWDVRIAPERDFAGLFPGCELGAEPPFGLLYHLPVVADPSLSAADKLLFRAGSHEEALELAFKDYVSLEWPLCAPIIQKRPTAPARRQASSGALSR